jgi:hypothetical protein
MIVIYHCWGGSHSSVTAASIHLGVLPTDRIPTKAEFMATGYYDQQLTTDHGKIFPLGTDEFGNQVCFMGREFCGDMVIRAIKGLGNIYDIDPHQIKFVDAMPCVNVVMMLGGSVSRALHLIAIGRPVVIRGTQQCYKRIIDLVESVKKEIANNTGV